MLSALLSLSHLILRTTQWDGQYCNSHFGDEKTEALIHDGGSKECQSQDSTSVLSQSNLTFYAQEIEVRRWRQFLVPFASFFFQCSSFLVDVYLLPTHHPPPLPPPRRGCAEPCNEFWPKSCDWKWHVAPFSCSLQPRLSGIQLEVQHPPWISFSYCRNQYHSRWLWDDPGSQVSMMRTALPSNSRRTQTMSKI